MSALSDGVAMLIRYAKNNMNDSRVFDYFKLKFEAKVKFDYFVTSVLVASLAWLIKNAEPTELGINVWTIELASLSALFASTFFSFLIIRNYYAVFNANEKVSYYSDFANMLYEIRISNTDKKDIILMIPNKRYPFSEQEIDQMIEGHDRLCQQEEREAESSGEKVDLYSHRRSVWLLAGIFLSILALVLEPYLINESCITRRCI